MSDVWSERAQAVPRERRAPRGAATSTCSSSGSSRRRETALDVATGGGHVARRLREVGVKVVTTDAAPGMQPDVITRAEHLPFDDGSFDAVVSRVAHHHFDDPGCAVDEMARVSGAARGRCRQPVHERRGRGGRQAPRPVARPQLHRGRVARDVRAAPASGRRGRALRQADRVPALARPRRLRRRRRRARARAARRPDRGRLGQARADRAEGP